MAERLNQRRYGFSAGHREGVKQFEECRQQASRPKAYGPRQWAERWRDRLRRVRLR